MPTINNVQTTIRFKNLGNLNKIIISYNNSTEKAAIKYHSNSFLPVITFIINTGIFSREKSGLINKSTPK